MTFTRPDLPFLALFGADETKAQMPNLRAAQQAVANERVSQALARKAANAQVTEDVPVSAEVRTLYIQKQCEELLALFHAAKEAGSVVETTSQKTS